jgi:hypothetical protein
VLRTDLPDMFADGKPAKTMRRFMIHDVDGKGLREGHAMAFAVS